MTNSNSDLLKAFPKQRPPLPPSYQKIFTQQYIENRSGKSWATGLSARLESWMHKKIANDAQKGFKGSTLELGAGTLNHLPYESSILHYDIVEPFIALFENSPHKSKIRNIYSNIDQLSDGDNYDRIISIAVLEHICDLPTFLAKASLHLKEDGCFRVAIPSEGTFLWTLGWSLTTAIDFRLRYGLPYGPIMRHEHVNNCFEINKILRLLFEEVHTSYFGASPHLSLYQVFICRRPKREICLDILRR